MFVGGQAPQYISRDRPSYGLRDTDGFSNGTHIICKFIRALSPQTDPLLERDGSERNKFVNLKEPHYMYPIYADQDLTTSQGKINMHEQAIHRAINAHRRSNKNDLSCV
jgi:hypothetical protein